MLKRIALAIVLLAFLGLPQQASAEPEASSSNWLGDLVTTLISLWDEATASPNQLDAPNPPSEGQQTEGETSEDDPPIANIHPGWDPVG